MKLRVVDEQFPDLLPMTGRSSGMHVSTVIKDLCIRNGIFKRRASDEGDAPVFDSVWGQLGSALEWAIIARWQRHFPGEYLTPPELELDGLYGHPDLLHLPTTTAHEIKLSWMSSDQDPHGEKFWRYWVQLQAYCAMMETQRGVLHVAFVNGSTKLKFGPVYRRYEAVFTMSELRDNWRMLTVHADYMRSQGHLGEIH